MSMMLPLNHIIIKTQKSTYCTRAVQATADKVFKCLNGLIKTNKQEIHPTEQKCLNESVINDIDVSGVKRQ